MTNIHEIIKINPYKDIRGELKKVFVKSMLSTEKSIEEIYVLHTKKGSVRGNHYHRQNVEFFTVIKGTAIIALKDIEEGEAEILKVSAGDDIVIKVPENVAHGFRNDEDEDLVILAAASKLYDPEDTDTYTFQLL
ncbi:MAG TPA: WxcM-like domain-containing protein [Clostridia bacterium]|nr:WxcM-like domain-containing protein [Clostridia bacterium]